MKASFSIASFVLGMGAFSAAVGCNSGGEPGNPADRIAAVKSALAKPSGKIDATTMKALTSSLSAIEAGGAVFAAFGDIGKYVGTSCASGNQSSGAIDLSCATGGQIKGSFDFTTSVVQNGDHTTVTFTSDLSDVCSAGVCVSGNMAMEDDVNGSSNSLTLAASVDVAEGTTTTHLFFGETVATDSRSTLAKIVLFDDQEASYVLDASATSSGASVSVVGQNGSFQCSFAGGGGSCSGAATFEF